MSFVLLQGEYVVTNYFVKDELGDVGTLYRLVLHVTNKFVKT